MYTKEQIAGRLVDIYGLVGKVAIVTGAASGLGRKTAELFAEVGAEVVVADLNADAAQVVADSINKAGGVAFAVDCDVSDEAAVKRLYKAVDERHGRVNILVNNAADRSKAEFFDMSVEQWDRMHAVNTRGTFLCMREALTRMRAQGQGGSIVNISSCSATHPNLWGLNTHYDSSKAGIDAITRVTAGEFGREGIRINSIQPGGMKSEGVAVMKDKFNLRGPALQPGRMPLGLCDPIEVARAVLFLASPAASYVTGQVWSVEGGFMVS